MGNRNQIPLSAYYVPSNLSLQPNILITYSRLAQLGDNAGLMANLCRCIYPFANYKVKSANFSWKMMVIVDDVPIWDTKIDGRLHHDNAMDLLLRLRRVVEGY
jgi:hypothetical protein